MYISKLQIKDFKSFFSSEELNFTPGFNLLVGKNNAGKTALVEALSLQFSNKPHRSTTTIPVEGMQRPGPSTVTIDFKLDVGEAEELYVINGNTVNVPIIQYNQPQQTADMFLSLLKQDNILHSVYQSDVTTFTTAFFEKLGRQSDPSSAITLDTDFSTQQLVFNNATVMGMNESGMYGVQLATILRRLIYFFKAERVNLTEYRLGTGTVLASNASNLPEVLHNLQSTNPSRFNQFNQRVQQIFPDVKGITIPPVGNDSVRILIWPIDPDSERSDLAVPLSDSGTGISQVLAILYVTMTAKHPQTIIIDEPQSFLHPGAIRKLFEILKLYPQHQFIITTHSPEIITSTNPSIIYLLHKEEFETKIDAVASDETQAQKIILSEVGAHLSDVFGADNILWVEGATEELCFPIIIDKILKRPLMGTKIIGVIQTGDFENRHSELIIQIYNKLSQSNGLIPPAVGFIFDREDRSEHVCYDIIRRSNGKVVFLPRRMYENYLLNPYAIASIASALPDFRSVPVTSEEIEQWLNQHHLEYCPAAARSELDGELWKQKVNGAKLLNSLFNEFSDCRYSYEKKALGLALTEWISDNVPGDLLEVAEVIKESIWPTENK
jgi:AAA15 family ATPase/GTPase